MKSKGILTDDLLEVKESSGGARWYNVEGHGWLPSVTTVLDYGFPKNYWLMEWFKKNTKEFCDEQRREAAERGSRIHAVAERLLNTGTFNTKILNPLERVDVRGLIQFKEDYNPKFGQAEVPVFVIEGCVEAAGRVDVRVEFESKVGPLDFKTGKGLYASHEAQLACYAKALGDEHAWLLHLNETKKGYTLKAVDVEKGWRLFEAAAVMFNELGPKPPSD